MTVLQSLFFLALFVPFVVIACIALAEKRREPLREWPMIPDVASGGGNGGGGGYDSGGCGGGDGGGS